MELLTPNFGLIFWTTIIFLSVLFILARYAWKPILGALDVREKSIAEALESAARAMEEMKKLQSDNERILNEAREERGKILKEAREQKDMIVNEAKEKAKIEATRIMEDSLREITNQKLAAITEVKNQVGNIAIEIATKVLEKELANKEEQEKYAASMVEKMNLN